ncbi:hypothetical protein LTR05_005221 [Lithohypha guttulata]|uniref:GATA-type domain-containing protein n=1 Tax=Lithohypha guttulata TaxID=1690604 RepID=A0AAN7Y6X8_9EURO|nr:hypothetical protein LTR05_005221 [Lithohypha guttulata]
MAEEESVTISVKLKVLYTFDVEHKVDHLSRPAQSYQVDTAAVDENTTIGVIDLRSCIDAMITSSPELTHFLENDYTVYVYDYSEPNIPLVGHGMLSKVLSQDAGSNEAMVTGKITKSVMAKFKKDVEPFLEVKLRLTPIASSSSRGRSGSMSSVQDGMQSQWSSFSQAGPAAMDRSQSPADQSRLDNLHRTLHEGSQRRDSAYNNSYSWGSSWSSSRPTTPTQQYQPPQLVSYHSRQQSQIANYGMHPIIRRGSESGYGSGDEVEEGPAKKRARITKVQATKKNDFNIEQRPNSLRTAAMGASSLRLHQPIAINPAVALQRGMSTEEPVRPPTPIVAPVRRAGRKPTGRPRGRPRKNRETSGEPSSPVQPPVQPRLLGSNVSSPEDTQDRQPDASIAGSPAHLTSSPPFLPPQMNAVKSPELPKKPAPPVHVPDSHDSGFFSAQVESTQAEADTPKQENAIDMDALFTDIDVNDYGDLSWLDAVDSTALDAGMHFDSIGVDNHYTPVFDEESTVGIPTPQPESQAGTKPIPTPQPEPQQPTEAVTSQQAPPQTIPTPTLQLSSKVLSQPQPEPPPTDSTDFQKPALPTSSIHPPTMPTDKNGRPVPTLLPRPRPLRDIQRSQSTLPPVPASDPGLRPLCRSNTCGPELMSDAIQSDAPADNKDGKKPPRKRIGKEQTKARLEQALASGAMPPYCHNCGAIETPAWRRAYIKHFECPINEVDTSLNQGELCYKEVLQSDSDGSVKSWRGWKVDKTQGQPEDGWELINLCNPCGLWLHKTKTVRPPEKWQKKDPKEKRKRKRPPKPPKSRTNPPRAAAGNLYSDALQSDVQEPDSEDSSPADTAMEDAGDDNNDTATIDGENNEADQEPELPPLPKAVMSVQLGSRTVKWADVSDRQAQSSPVGRGTIDEPINIDRTPDKPLRRRLFSPNTLVREEDTALPSVLGEKKNTSLLPSFVRRSPRINKIRDIFDENQASATVSVDAVNGTGKENVAPLATPGDYIDDFIELFGDNDEVILPPATPTPRRRSERILLRTPGKTPSRELDEELSINVQLSSSSTKTPKQGFKDVAELFMDTITRNLDPKFMTPNTRAVHKACYGSGSPTPRRVPANTGFTPRHNTPGRASLDFNFPDLPSLKTSSPMSHDALSYGLPELSTDTLHVDIEELLTTDVHMPSSPPVSGSARWNFDHEDDFGGMVRFEESDDADTDADIPTQGTSSLLKTPRKQTGTGMLEVATPSSAGLRRSPRHLGRD